MPLTHLCDRLGKKQLLSIASYHHILNVNHHMSRDTIQTGLLHHECTTCPQFISIFTPISSPKTSQQKVKAFRQKQTQSASVQSDTVFPPKPLNYTAIHDVVTGFAEDIQINNFLESGCAVCGLLTPQNQLQKLNATEFDRELLVSDYTVTRQQRRTEDDPIVEIPGPVILPNCNDICLSCVKELQGGKMPVDSLANGLWIGDIPIELQGLSWTEKMIISRVKHNMCIVKVHVSGMSKMKANVVSHSLPMPKIY